MIQRFLPKPQGNLGSLNVASTDVYQTLSRVAIQSLGIATREFALQVAALMANVPAAWLLQSNPAAPFEL